MATPEENQLDTAKELRLGQKFIFQNNNNPKHTDSATLERNGSDQKVRENL